MLTTFRPLIWTGVATPASQRRSRHTFKANWSNTLNLLDRELSHLEVQRLVIEADFQEGDIKLDGMPRANARQPRNPGVRVAFDSIHGPLIYQTDVCEFWQHNVRSIALGLEALRAVDRYGISSRAEQYQGYKQLAAGPTKRRVHFQSAEEGLRWLQSQAPDVRRGISVKGLIRHVAMEVHPDRDGDELNWEKFAEARTLLETAGMV